MRYYPVSSDYNPIIIFSNKKPVTVVTEKPDTLVIEKPDTVGVGGADWFAY